MKLLSQVEGEVAFYTPMTMTTIKLPITLHWAAQLPH